MADEATGTKFFQDRQSGIGIARHLRNKAVFFTFLGEVGNPLCNGPGGGGGVINFMPQTYFTAGYGFKPKQRLAQARPAGTGQSVNPQDLAAIGLKIYPLKAVGLQITYGKPGFAQRPPDQAAAVSRRLIGIRVADNSVDNGAFAQRCFTFVIDHAATAHDGCFITDAKYLV